MVLKQAIKVPISPVNLCGAMAHDLKNIFAGIKMYCTILQKESVENPTVRECADIIESNSNDSLNMISAYLDSLRLDTNDFKLDLQSWDMNKRMFSVKKFISPAAKAKNISIKVDYSPKSADLDMDRLKFRRVLVNLLTNAIKFTETGGEIFISINSTEDNIEVSISDTGIGIPKRLLPYIFDQFTKASRKGTNEEKTIGIGLWTTKKIVELHGGQISVKSKVNKGTKFEIKMPKNKGTVPNIMY